MSKKCINVYYKDIMRKINYFGTFNDVKIKENLKILYHIKEPIEKIFFVDDNADIMILEGDNVPDNLNVHLYVECDPIPQNPENELEVEESNSPDLIKFHWVFFNESLDTNKWNGVISENKYTYNAINSTEDNPIVVSSKALENGKFFVVIRKGIVSYYSGLCIINSEYKYAPGQLPYNCDEFIGRKAMENDTQNIGILVDCINKKVKFYDYFRRSLIISKDINCQSVK